MLKKTHSLIALAVFVLSIATACAATASPPPLTPITVQLRWTHQAQFGGFYAADQLGYYAVEGLSVKFVQGGAGIDVFAPVLDGTAQFGVHGADNLIAQRANGDRVKAIAVIYRRSPVVIAAPAESGISRPQDLIGKTIRMSSLDALTIHTMLSKAGVRPDQYKEIVLPSDLGLFEAGKADAWDMYLNAFAVTVQSAGHKLNFIYPDDYGVHFYADTIFTTDEMIANNPDLVTRFLRATLKGWTYAVQNPTTIGPMVVKYNPKGKATVENAGMVASIPIVNTGEDHIGWMKPEIWAGMEQTLRSQNALTKPLTITDVYTLEFLRTIYASNP